MSGAGVHDTARSTFVTVRDGLRLHVREYGARTAAGLPVVCLPGLARTVADFATLAPFLARTAAAEHGGAAAHPQSGTDPVAVRRVIAVDSRGRGRSDYDRNPDNYNLVVELADLRTVLTTLDVGAAVFVGSSRGGLLVMQLAVVQPTAIAGVVLHDIGPVIEQNGLARIKSYVGKLPQPRDFADGAEILRRLFGPQFPKFTDGQWLTAASRTWQMHEGALKPTYDVGLSKLLAAVDTEQPLPPLWNEFDALARVPMLVIHGANSDILSAETLAAMAARHPGMQTIEIPHQGHVPALEGEDLLQHVAAFVAECDHAFQRASGLAKRNSD
ncbi:MAG TPA: alpha/beta hydrolase [Xanthobacteraceae bacterium]|jgi:pimeloyl-ACP methyl ester carboxylesterase